MSSVGSVYDSPRNCDPIIYGESHLSDVDFSSLFAADASIEDGLHFFKDGFAAPDGHDDLDANGFTFDSMVDLDACQPTTSSNNKDTRNKDDLSVYSDVYTREHSPEGYDSPFQNAATSSAQQPILGAPA